MDHIKKALKPTVIAVAGSAAAAGVLCLVASGLEDFSLDDFLQLFFLVFLLTSGWCVFTSYLMIVFQMDAGEAKKYGLGFYYGTAALLWLFSKSFTSSNISSYVTVCALFIAMVCVLLRQASELEKSERAFDLALKYPETIEETIRERKQRKEKISREAEGIVSFVFIVSLIFAIGFFSPTLYETWASATGHISQEESEKIAREKEIEDSYWDGYEDGVQEGKQLSAEALTIDGRSIQDISDKVYEVYGMTPNEAWVTIDDYTYDSTHGGITWEEYQNAIEAAIYTAALFPWDG